MADYYNSMPVFTRSNEIVRVAGYTGSADVVVKCAAGGEVYVIASDLDIRNIVNSQDNILIYGLDGSTNRAVKVNGNGELVVALASGITIYQYQDGVSGTGAYGMVAMGLDSGSNLQFISVDTSGRLILGAGSQVIGGVKLIDSAGTNAAAVDASGRVAVDLQLQTLTAVKVSKDANANTAINPIYVQVVEGVASGEVHDYKKSDSIAAGLTDNHDYVVTGGKTFLFRDVIVSASGAVKAEIQVDLGAGLVTKFVVFTSMGAPWINNILPQPIEIAATKTVRVIVTNRERSAMDIYSTIVGEEI